MSDLTALLDRLEAVAKQATPGPWAIDSCGEKGDGAEVIGVIFGPDDRDCERPRSGRLEPFDHDGEPIDYYRDEEVAACEHRNRNSYNSANFIAACSPEVVLALVEVARAASAVDAARRKWEAAYDRERDCPALEAETELELALQGQSAALSRLAALGQADGR